MSTPQRKGLEGSPDTPPAATPSSESAVDHSPPAPAVAPRELGGVAGPDPTRFGDWEKNGRCIDF